ncbi:TonB-dependent receptor [Marinifilum caeruleilacunae]|uniref:TonB-dependent receptor n=1 Tax=Marinifilum caeruleilacunae TaxID=2499076 RepID=A0ABX1WR16_9BACT|nr:TonB-dependent receptor [Marinifilum caeruleilacunae]NOU58373.1 TonB-dependent receptor [Marinifilum caeruleilacunae]
MHKIFCVLLMQVLCIAAFSQKLSLKGKVYDNNSKEGIEYAYIYLDGIQSSSVSQNGGYYSLENLQKGKYKLCVSVLGYQAFSKDIELITSQKFDIGLDPKSFSIEPIVITGTGTQHRIDKVPVQTEIISKKDIAEQSGRNIEEILSGISSSIDYTSSSMGSNIKINGLGKDYVLILLNGKRLTGGVGGYADLSRINSDDIEQIEVVKGASSTLYGSDAIAGVINIITKKVKGKFSATSSSRLGAYGDFKQLNSFTFSKDKLSGKTTFNYKQKAGYQLNSMKYNNKWESNHDLPYLVRTHYKPTNKSKAYTIRQFLGYEVNQKLSIDLNLSWYEKTLYFPFKAQMHNYYYNDRSVSLGGRYQLKNKNYLSFNFDVDNYLYYTEYPYKYNETYITSKDVIKKTYYPGDRFKNSDVVHVISQLKGVFNLNDKHKLSLGSEIKGEYLEAKYRLNNPEASAYTYSLYAQDEFKLANKLDIVAGIRSLYHDKSGFSLTPKLTMMYKEDQFTHRFTYSNGYKSPTLKELYYYYESNRMGMYRLYLGNEDLKAQKSHYFALSSEFKANKFRTGLSLYLNRIYDKIDYKIIPTSYDHARRGIEETKKRYNIDKARTLGADWHMSFPIYTKLFLSGNYSYVSARNITQDIRLNGVSEHSATWKLSWTERWNSQKLNINLSGVYKSDRFYLEEDLERSYADPYQLWKLSSSYSFKKWKHYKIRLTAGIDNLFDDVDDRPYGSHYSTLNPGRTLFIGLNVDFAN